MDLVDFSAQKFNDVVAEYKKFLSQIGLEARDFRPDFRPLRRQRRRNPARPAAALLAGSAMPWYSGSTITEMLDNFEPPKPLANFRSGFRCRMFIVSTTAASSRAAWNRARSGWATN